ncbi:MAG TPA: DUF4143 domain-containing protein [Casimicrobiaceae bacterium]
MGLQYVTAALERLMLYRYPTIVVVLSALFFRQRITARMVLALVLSYAWILDEVGTRNFDRLWRRGGLPRSYLARSEAASFEWRRAFVQSFVERDLPQLGVNISPATMRRFWAMLANYHGQVWNASEFGRSFGVADTTVRGYLDRLTSALVVRQLAPWHENIGKRQVRAPKVYMSDSGLLHALLNLRTKEDLEAHPKIGASWEGFVIEQVIRRLGVETSECFFWATHAGAELDLLVVHGRSRLGFEIKRTAAPTMTRSAQVAIQDLKLKRLDVIHAGDHSFPLGSNVRAVAIGRLLDDIELLAWSSDTGFLAPVRHGRPGNR